MAYPSRCPSQENKSQAKSPTPPPWSSEQRQCAPRWHWHPALKAVAVLRLHSLTNEESALKTTKSLVLTNLLSTQDPFP